MAQGLDGSFQAACFVGYHARAGVPHGVLNHTWMGKEIQNVYLNGEVCGETRLVPACAGFHGVPVVLVTGDEAVGEEARELLGDVETVAVKKGIDKFSAELLPPSVAQARIREATARALDRLSDFTPYTVGPPYTLGVEWNSTAIAAAWRWSPASSGRARATPSSPPTTSRDHGAVRHLRHDRRPGRLRQRPVRLTADAGTVTPDVAQEARRLTDGARACVGAGHRGRSSGSGRRAAPARCSRPWARSAWRPREQDKALRRPPQRATSRCSGRAAAKVVILGAGIAGLTAAYELGKAGYDCTVLEARRPGRRAEPHVARRRPADRAERRPTQTVTFGEGTYFNAGPGPDRAVDGHHGLLPRAGRPDRDVHQQQRARRTSTRSGHDGAGPLPHGPGRRVRICRRAARQGDGRGRAGPAAHARTTGSGCSTSCGSFGDLGAQAGLPGSTRRGYADLPGARAPASAVARARPPCRGPRRRHRPGDHLRLRLRPGDADVPAGRRHGRDRHRPRRGGRRRTGSGPAPRSPRSPTWPTASRSPGSGGRQCQGRLLHRHPAAAPARERSRTTSAPRSRPRSHAHPGRRPARSAWSTAGAGGRSTTGSTAASPRPTWTSPTSGTPRTATTPARPAGRLLQHRRGRRAVRRADPTRTASGRALTQGKKIHGEKYRAGVLSSASIAWERQPHIEGGWVRWPSSRRPSLCCNGPRAGSTSRATGSPT